MTTFFSACCKKLQRFGVSRFVFFILTLTLFISCRQKKTEVPLNVSPAEISISGKFVKIQPIDDRHYELYLRSDNDSINVFVTLMPLNQTEISSLKKEGKNILLTYQEHYNPVKKQTEKIVIKMWPQYEF
jgi:hypothetical protein